MTAPARKCGRIRPSAAQKRAMPHLADFLKAPLPLDETPDECDNVAGAPIDMGGNDAVGDCTIAGEANWFAIVAHKLGLSIKIVAATLIAFYRKMTGGPDNGLNEIDVMQEIVTNGLDVGDGVIRKNTLYVRVPLDDHRLVRFLIWKFWALYLGAELPDFALSSDVWNGPANLRGHNAPKSENGHCFLVGSFGKLDARGVCPYGYVTWGTVIPGDSDFMDDYVDEGYLQLDEARAAALGVDWDALVSYVKSVEAMG